MRRKPPTPRRKLNFPGRKTLAVWLRNTDEGRSVLAEALGPIYVIAEFLPPHTIHVFASCPIELAIVRRPDGSIHTEDAALLDLPPQYRQLYEQARCIHPAACVGAATYGEWVGDWLADEANFHFIINELGVSNERTTV